MANSFHPRSQAARAAYGRYTDGPDPLAPPVDLAEAMEAIGRDVMDGSSPRRAMQEFLRRGGQQLRGLDDLARQAYKRRQQMLKRNNLDGTMQQVRELLDQAVLAERKQLARDLDDEARFAEFRMEQLPSSTAQAVNELADYDFRSSEAREAYQQIKDLIGTELMDQRFAGMKKALENATDADRAAAQEMLSDLNDLLAAHQRAPGHPDTDQQFADFMAKHGDYFPDDPSTVEELIDSLAQRAAAAQRMMNSMTAEQRAELESLSQQAFGSPALMEQLAQLDANLQSMRPGEDWESGEQFSGQQGMGWGEGTQAMQDIADLEQLGDQLSQQYAGATMDDVDLDLLERQLGPQAAVDARTLAELEKALTQQGYLDRGADGSWRLSPKAMRQLAQSQLRDVAARLSGRTGQRQLRRAGSAGDITGASREWQFGDTEPWDVTGTVTNAVLRTASERGLAEPPVQIAMGDIVVSETEARTQAAVALLVDVSFSMFADGRWLPMKQTALALSHLVSTRFRGDALQIIAFGPLAHTMSIGELTALEPSHAKGTNLQHALLLANRHFRRHPAAQPVALVVTDGEPTSHLMPDGSPYFNYPPDAFTLGMTVRELDHTARMGAQTTFYRLGDDPGLARFVDKMAARIKGKVVAPDLDGLGAAVVEDYLSSRRRRNTLW